MALVTKPPKQAKPSNVTIAQQDNQLQKKEEATSQATIKGGDLLKWMMESKVCLLNDEPLPVNTNGLLLIEETGKEPVTKVIHDGQPVSSWQQWVRLFQANPWYNVTELWDILPGRTVELFSSFTVWQQELATFVRDFQQGYVIGMTAGFAAGREIILGPIRGKKYRLAAIVQEAINKGRGMNTLPITDAAAGSSDQTKATGSGSKSLTAR